MGAVARRLFEDAFNDELLSQVEANPNTRSWSAAGRGRTKKLPQGEDGSWWRENGPDMVQAWIDWRYESGWKVWSTPDGQAAIELEIIADCEYGDTVIPVKMIIDRVMVMPETRELIILDLKSGSRTPDSDLQLAFYRYGLYQRYGVDVKWGTYWMARKGQAVDPFPLERYAPELMEVMFRRFRKAIDEDIFLPHPSMKCRACAVNKYCAVYGGSQAAQRDPDHPEFGLDTGAAETEPEAEEIEEETAGENVSE